MRSSLIKLTGLVGACIGILGITRTANAQFTANILFDGTFDNTLTPPYVGSGTLSMPTFSGFGTFVWNTINPTISLNVEGQIFTNADIVSNNSLTELVVQDLGPTTGGELVGIYFDDPGAGAGGPFGGSLDLVNGASQDLSFEPSYVASPPLDLYFSSAVEGTYGIEGVLATSTPEPGSIALFAGAAVGVGAFVTRRRVKAK